VAVVQYTFTHKQYTERHKTNNTYMCYKVKPSDSSRSSNKKWEEEEGDYDEHDDDDDDDDDDIDELFSLANKQK